MSAFVCATPMMRINMVARGNAVSHAGISGRRQSTKPLRKTPSMGQDSEGWDVNEVQIPGTKSALERSLLDTLLYYKVFLGFLNFVI